MFFSLQMFIMFWGGGVVWTTDVTLWLHYAVQLVSSVRQRKDELEQRMSTLQESRRELMVQLEQLMMLLKVLQMCLSSLSTVQSDSEQFSFIPSDYWRSRRYFSFFPSFLDWIISVADCLHKKHGHVGYSELYIHNNYYNYYFTAGGDQYAPIRDFSLYYYFS